jgi:hypothetical protein
VVVQVVEVIIQEQTAVPVVVQVVGYQYHLILLHQVAQYHIK